MRKRKILVTGSNGTVGSYISSAFLNDTLHLSARKDLDIVDKKSVSKTFEIFSPNIVIHLGAKTNVDACEKESEDAYLVNVQGTQNIAELCKKFGSKLIYVSTGAVFNGKKEYFTEEDKPDPINIYGKTKLYGEEAVKKTLKDHIILRAGWIVGGGRKEKKFISYIVQQVNSGATEINVINDKFGTLTYAKELVAYMKFLLDKEATGIYHFGSLGICTRYEIAKTVLDTLHKKIRVNPVSSAMFSDTFFAPRPAYEVLQSVKLDPAHSTIWQQSLRNYIMDELQNE